MYFTVVQRRRHMSRLGRTIGLIGPKLRALRCFEFLVEDEGTTVPEYTVMLAMIVLAAVGAISGIGAKVGDVYASLDSGVTAGMGG